MNITLEPQTMNVMNNKRCQTLECIDMPTDKNNWNKLWQMALNDPSQIKSAFLITSLGTEIQLHALWLPKSKRMITNFY